MSEHTNWLRIAINSYTNLLRAINDRWDSEQPDYRILLLNGVLQQISELSNRYNIGAVKKPISQIQRLLKIEPVDTKAINEAIEQLNVKLSAYGNTISTDQIINLLMVCDRLQECNRLMPELALQGFLVTSVPNAQTAIEKLTEDDYSLIIFSMSEMRKEEINQLQLLRSDQSAVCLPLLLITENTDPLLSSLALLSGVDFGVSRDYTATEIGSIVSGIIRRRIEILRDSRTDLLTGLPNRSSFIEMFNGVRRLADREKKPLSIAILDIDFFKHVNDTYGHEMGDKVLEQLSFIVSGALRKSDYFARWGGEEFLILLPHTDPGGGKRAIEKALAKVAEHFFTAPNGKTFNVTFSGGVAEVKAGMTLGESVSTADRLLYLAKKTGRNRVLADGNIEQTKPIRTVLIADPAIESFDVLKKNIQEQGYRIIEVADQEQLQSELALKGISLVVSSMRWGGSDCC